ncbi:hypothetical protein O181_078535 [Austropuccinia psidii MF-1]|uniref:Uncharacterized protein n=1 Tax=Austropuccinia psidii MF-1 TaxID=1389203 RepID=A0A9Q3FJW0_9BASI|nr:hypothetical protein [Austropuccinia psidii MF-1]
MVSQVSNQTIQHKIHKLGKLSLIAPKEPYLQPEDFQAHLTFSQAHINWTTDDWAWVIWTDESSFKLGKFFWPTSDMIDFLGKKVNCVCMWRTTSEKWLLENLAVNYHSGQQSVMIWGAICAAKQSLVAILEGHLTSAKIICQAYRPSLHPFSNHMETATWIQGRH